jgi:hypothetical protein
MLCAATWQDTGNRCVAGVFLSAAISCFGMFRTLKQFQEADHCLPVSLAGVRVAGTCTWQSSRVLQLALLEDEVRVLLLP